LKEVWEMRRKVFLLIFTILLAFTGQRSYSAGANMTDYCYVPPTISASVPPNVMIMLSIETPMQGTAHPPITCTGDPRTSYSCTFASCSYVVSWRRVDNCYDNNKTYYGYFDPNKCYNYVGGGTGGRFEPVGLATNHQCSGSWSGNFLNWATTMAVDAFRKAMTGGNRAVDSTGNTQLLGARQTLSPGHNWFPIKRIDNANLYTPYTGTIYLIRYANGFVVCEDTNNDGLPDCGVGQSGSGENLFPTVSNKRCSNDVFKACNTNSDCGSGATCQTVSGAIAAFNLKIEVCNPSKGLEPNCNPSNNKPEGVIQKYADKMRFGLISYALHNNPDRTRDGGVIRANMKWISHKIPYGMKYHDANGDLVVCNNAGGCPNPEAEINADGTFISNPDNIPGASYSGVINYINKFGYNAGYKSFDPISEMYYEIIRYFKILKSWDILRTFIWDLLRTIIAMDCKP
jgi:type IV pilus assembly protein PilY1